MKHLVTMVIAALTLLATTGVSTLSAAAAAFDDVDPGAYYADAVNSLAAAGMFHQTECGERRFCPDDPLRRGDMAIWLVRAVDGSDPTSLPAEARFEDTGFYEWPFTERLYDLEISRGCNRGEKSFCPDAAVTRAQMATFLVRAFDLKPGPDAGFEDTVGTWNEADINAVAAAGITSGCGDGTRFCSNKATTRGQMALFLVRAMDHIRPSSGPRSCDFSAHSDAVRAATYQVHAADGIGTAFYVGGGQWITAEHVVRGNREITLRRGTREFVATVEAVVADADLALLKSAEPSNLQPLSFGDALFVKAGADVYVVGYPQYVASSAAVSRGVLSRIERWDRGQVVVTDAAVNPGNSGGPLVDTCGRVLGVVMSKWVEVGVEGLAYAMGESTIRQYLPAMRAGDWKPSGPAAVVNAWTPFEGERLEGTYVGVYTYNNPNTLYVRCTGSSELHVFVSWSDMLVTGDWGYIEYQFGDQTSVVGEWGIPNTSATAIFFDDSDAFLDDLLVDTSGYVIMDVWDYDESYNDYQNDDAYDWQGEYRFNTTGAKQHVQPILTACGL